MPAAASAPGKIILLGEHAVVYGEPVLACAVDLRVRVRIDELPEGTPSSVNGYPLTDLHHGFLVNALALACLETPVRVLCTSELPSAAGLGSSAALTVAGTTAALALRGGLPDAAPGVPLSPAATEQVARLAYEAEWRAQGGRGSPTDTSVSSRGGAVLLNDDPAGAALSFARGERTWHVHDLALPDLTLVIGSTAARGRTSEQVEKVRRLVTKRAFARGVIRDIGLITREAVGALESRDKERLGALMDRNHNLLAMLGVSTDALDRLVAAARRSAYGAKLTGSGGGGSMIALTDDPTRTATDLARLGARVHVVKLASTGATLDTASQES